MGDRRLQLRWRQQAVLLAVAAIVAACGEPEAGTTAGEASTTVGDALSTTAGPASTTVAASSARAPTSSPRRSKAAETGWRRRRYDAKVVEALVPLTVEAVFDLLERTLADGPDAVTAGFHPQLGYLTDAYVDRITNAVDDELGLAIIAFTPG